MPHPIPLAIIQDLKCGHCKKFVTCGPVHVTPNSGILCGRCASFAKPTYRNIAFEAIASIYYYPCYYWPQHCDRKLNWNDSLDHERNCSYQSTCNIFCSRPGSLCKSDRKYQIRGEVNLEHVTEDILEHLKCMACESYLSNTPVYIVVDGKNICHRCSHSNGIPKGAIRNLAYETIASAIIFPCIYRFRGCTIRLKFGRDLWAHEYECPYGQSSRKISKKPSKGGKERGVIETHSGHIYGTITPHSAAFAPPKTHNEGKVLTQELEGRMKKKYKEDEIKNIDSQSMNSVASTLDSVGDNISRSTVDNISRSSSRQRTRDENYSMNNFYRPSTSSPTGPQKSPTGPPYVHMTSYEMNRQQKSMMKNDEIVPSPRPAGYNRISFNGHYQDNMASYGHPSHLDQNMHLYHFPPIYAQDGVHLNYSPSFNNYPPGYTNQISVQRNESLRVGNPEIIHELRERNQKKHSQGAKDNRYAQDTHDEVFIN